MPQVWIVRAGQDDKFRGLAFARNVIAVGWHEVSDLTNHPSWGTIHTAVKQAYAGVSAFTVDSYTRQLYAFRTIMAVGDIVLWLASTTPDVAVCEITGEYAYRPDLGAARHVRTVRWLQKSLNRSEIGIDLFDIPALSVVHHVNKNGVLSRLKSTIGGATTPTFDVEQEPPTAEPETPTTTVETPETSKAYRNLTKNLNYARNLTAAGKHFSELGITRFEISDIYRAAWVQAVAALDQWVRREIHERMLKLSANPHAIAKPERYRNFELSLGAIEEVQAGARSLQEVLDERLKDRLWFATYQDPGKIRQGFGHVMDVDDFWGRVTRVLNEQAGATHAAGELEKRLRDIVHRRNKIAHEYDEDPTDSSKKRTIDAEETMRTIELIDQIAAAVTVTLNGADR